MAIVFQLCEGRHPIPGNPPAIFGNTVNPMDFDGLVSTANAAIPDGTDAVTVFVTGLTPAMLAVASVCFRRGISLTALHFNRETANFEPQTVFSFDKCGFCDSPVPRADFSRVCGNCGG